METPPGLNLGRIAIVGYRLSAPDQLLAHPLNARRHPGEQRDALRASMDALGWVAPVLVNQRTQHVLDGHARVEEAISAGVPEIPVLDIDIPETQEPLFLSIYDPISTLAVYDADAYTQLLTALDAVREDVPVDESLDALIRQLAYFTVAPAPPASSTDAPPETFPAYDADIPTNRQCPSCGFQWSDGQG